MATTQALHLWRKRRFSLRCQWFVFVIVAVIGTAVFLRSMPADPLIFAMLLMIPLISLYQAWKTDRAISACSRHIIEQENQHEPH